MTKANQDSVGEVIDLAARGVLEAARRHPERIKTENADAVPGGWETLEKQSDAWVNGAHEVIAVPRSPPAPPVP